MSYIDTDGTRDHNLADILKAKLGDVTAELKDVVAKRADADKTEIRTELDERIKTLTETVERLEKNLEENAARGGMVPGVEPGAGKNQFSLARAIKGIVLSKRDPRVWDRKEFGLEGEYFKEQRAILDGLPENVQKVMHHTGGDDHGGYLVATELIPGIIEFLRENALIYQAGARRMDGMTSDLEWVRQITGMSHTWFGSEADSPGTIAESEATFGNVTASPKTVGARAKISWLMLKQPAANIEDFVRQEIAAVLALAESNAAFKGGGSNEPTGILGTSGIGDVDTAFNAATVTASPDPAVILAYFREFVQTLRSSKALGLPGARMAWVVEDLVAQDIEGFVDKADERSLFLSDDQALASQLLRFPLLTNLSTDFVGGASARSILFGDFNQCVIPHWGGLSLDVTDSDGTDFQSGVITVRGIEQLDVAVLQPAAFVEGTDYND